MIGSKFTVLPKFVLSITPIFTIRFSRLLSVESYGRVVIDLLDETITESLVIRDGDRLTIPEKPGHIYIYGEVSYEGALKYEETKKIDYYLNKSGGLKENADMEAIYVLHPNGDTQRYTLKKSLFQNNPDKEFELFPGSVIFIPTWP